VPRRKLKKPQQESSLVTTVTEWVTKLAAHFNQPQDDDQLEIFIHALRNNSLYQIRTAFDRCLNECEFMPRLAQVHAKMPADREPPGACGYVIRLRPLLELNTEIAIQIATTIIGKNYDELTDSPEDDKLRFKLFFHANHARYEMMCASPEDYKRWTGGMEFTGTYPDLSKLPTWSETLIDKKVVKIK